MFPKSKTPARKKPGGAAQQTPLDRELRRFCEDVRGRIESVRANAFFHLARRLFASNRALLNFIQGVSIGGTEKRVIINKTVSGFADFAHERLIMEFKRNLSSGPALTQAKKQLWTYFRGLHDEDRQNLFGVGEKSELWRLVATDGVVWRVFGVNYHSFAEAGKLVEKADDGLVQLAEFNAESRSAAEFRDFLRDSVFSDPERRLSAANIHRDFGVSSPLYRDVRAAMQQALPLLSGDEATVAHNEWREYFSRVYGADGEEANLEKFYLHTYLATFAKILGWHVLNRRRERMDVKRMNKTVMRGVIDGSAFRKLHVENFADRDFFAWTLEKRHFDNIYPVFKRIANTVANYVFASPGHDLLQGVYQDIVDADTRHSLGEYYTPDWLCERIVRRLNPDADARIFDPACGSGSFLRAAAAAKIRSPRANAGHIAERTVGMDIHPVAVQLAKTNLLMALNPLMRGRGAGKKITLRVYLANTLLREERDQIVRDQSRIRIKLRDFDKRGNQGRRSNGRDPESVVVTVRDKSRWYYNDAVALCDELSHHRILIPTGEFARRFAARLGADLSDKNTAQVMSEYREVYRRMRAAKTTGQNSIWAYVLKNLAQPLVLRGEFDHVIGNPPWLTYKDVATAEYQGDISAIADHYRLKPGAANMTHLELATLFASHCAESFLKKDGNLSFVMSASILDQGNHEPIRQGRARGFSVREIWDLSEVAPLFNIKSMVLFANREPETRTDLAEKYGGGFPGQRVTAKLPMRDVSLKEFEDHARARKVQWRLQPLSPEKRRRAADHNVHRPGHRGQRRFRVSLQIHAGRDHVSAQFLLCGINGGFDSSGHCGMRRSGAGAHGGPRRQTVAVEPDKTEGGGESRPALPDGARRASVSVSHGAPPLGPGSFAPASGEKRRGGHLRWKARRRRLGGLVRAVRKALAPPPDGAQRRKKHQPRRLPELAEQDDAPALEDAPSCHLQRFRQAHMRGRAGPRARAAAFCRGKRHLLLLLRLGGRMPLSGGGFERAAVDAAHFGERQNTHSHANLRPSRPDVSPQG